MSLQSIQNKNFDGIHGRVAVILADFHQEISAGLLEGLEAVFQHYEAVEWDVVRVPGAFEIPLMAKNMAAEEWDVIVALGCIVKGDTYHFEMVANECARGCMEVMLQTGIPVVMEVLAPMSYEDGLKRSQGEYNHGRYAAQVALDWLGKRKK